MVDPNAPALPYMEKLLKAGEGFRVQAYGGIPIRLEIAARILAQTGVKAVDADVDRALVLADLLIERHMVTAPAAEEPKEGTPP